MSPDPEEGISAKKAGTCGGLCSNLALFCTIVKGGGGRVGSVAGIAADTIGFQGPETERVLLSSSSVLSIKAVGTFTGLQPPLRASFDELGDSFDVMSSLVLAAPCVLPGRTIGLPKRCEEGVMHGETAGDGFLPGRDGPPVDPTSQPDRGTRCFGGGGADVRRLTARADRGERYGLASSISCLAEWASSAMQHPPIVLIVGRDGGTVSSGVCRILLGTQREEAFWLRWLTAAVIVAPLFGFPPYRPPRRSTR